MINLENTTFIIPIYIESIDRLNNARTVLGYLNKWFKTNVIIHELIDDVSKLTFLDTFKNLNIKHLTENREYKNYHRTRQLNEMLDMVETLVTVNYDIDILLPIKSYVIAEYMILNGECDVVYPYGFGDYQYEVMKGRGEFYFDIDNINGKYLNNHRSEYGHCIFFNTNTYKKYGGENENFISYGPEDYERYERFKNLGCGIKRIDDYVYHLEHDRTSFSSEDNPDFNKNKELYMELKNYPRNNLLSYYRSVNYLSKYNFDRVITSDNIKYSSKSVISSVKSDEPKNEIIYLPINNRIINNNLCSCGEPKNKIKYNFCQKCNKLY